MPKNLEANNLNLWNAVKQVPPNMLKQIQAGRLKGKSDINPQWRYQAMTEQFGLCGIGWKYEVLRLWTEPAPKDQIFAFAEIALYIKYQDVWSDAIPGIGGHMLIVSESAGLHANDEGYKMAITDALSVAMKMLGFGADVYAGLWDGSKYRDVHDKPRTTSNSPGDDPGTQKEHWCSIHNTEFFMRGKMKSYAHPVEGQKEWCYEYKDAPVSAPDASISSPADPTSTTPPDKLEEGQNEMPWEKFYEIAANLGFKGASAVARALGVKDIGQWTETKEIALDRLGELQMKNWRLL